MSDLRKNNYKLDNPNNKHKHFPSSTREWNNSIYVYNKNSLNSVPTTTNTVMEIIRIYFNFFNRILEKKMRAKRLLLRYRRNSSNKIYLSNGEFKHTNNKVLINIYLYNRQKYNYLNKLRTNFLKKFLSKKGKINIKKNSSNSRMLSNRKSINAKVINNLRIIYDKGMEYLKNANNNKYILIRALKQNPKFKISSFKYITKSTINFYKKVLRKSMKKLLMYFFYRQLIYINKSKLNYNYLQVLKVQLEKLYNKNVEFNLINLKNIFLNSDIMSEVARLKLTRNRRRLLKLMNKMKNRIKVHKKHISLEEPKRSNQVVKLNDLRSNENELKTFVISNLKYKDITGYRLEAKGRLTRRHKAARAVSKSRYKGNLSDLDASRKGLSSVILRGNLRSNLQNTKSYSKTKIGAFGLKGWISSY